MIVTRFGINKSRRQWENIDGGVSRFYVVCPIYEKTVLHC